MTKKEKKIIEERKRKFYRWADQEEAKLKQLIKNGASEEEVRICRDELTRLVAKAIELDQILTLLG